MQEITIQQDFTIGYFDNRPEEGVYKRACEELGIKLMKIERKIIRAEGYLRGEKIFPIERFYITVCYGSPDVLFEFGWKCNEYNIHLPFELSNK